MQELEKDMGKLNVQEGTSHGKGGKQHAANNAQRQGSVPPRLQSEQKGSSKRYSSMRQRSLPESATPPNYPTSFYPNGELHRIQCIELLLIGPLIMLSNVII